MWVGRRGSCWVARFGPEIIGYKGRPIVIYGSAAAALVAALALIVMGRRWVQGSRIVAARAGAGSNDPGANGTSTGPTDVSQREIDALDDALDEIDEF